MSSRIGEKPSKTPALVATAFPPLNPAKLGKCAPKRLRDQRPSARSLNSKSRKENGQSSFQEINRKDNDPSFLPKIRKVLVVPVLPEPCSRKFIWKKIFPIHNPKEWSLTDRLKLKHLFLLSTLIISKTTIEKAISEFKCDI